MKKKTLKTVYKIKMNKLCRLLKLINMTITQENFRNVY